MSLPSMLTVMDYATAKRFLVIFLYLNDNDEGQTVFPEQNFTSQCKQGNVLFGSREVSCLETGNRPVWKHKLVLAGNTAFVLCQQTT